MKKKEEILEKINLDFKFEELGVNLVWLLFTGDARKMIIKRLSNFK